MRFQRGTKTNELMTICVTFWQRTWLHFSHIHPKNLSEDKFKSNGQICLAEEISRKIIFRLWHGSAQSSSPGSWQERNNVVQILET